MKSNYKDKMFYTQVEVEKYIQDEWKKREQALFDDCKQDIAAQLMAVCCKELNIEFGFGKKRLKRFMNGVQSLFKIMVSDKVMGKEVTTQNCIDLMRNQFGIDLDKKIG